MRGANQWDPVHTSGPWGPHTLVFCRRARTLVAARLLREDELREMRYKEEMRRLAEFHAANPVLKKPDAVACVTKLQAWARYGRRAGEARVGLGPATGISLGGHPEKPPGLLILRRAIWVTRGIVPFCTCGSLMVQWTYAFGAHLGPNHALWCLPSYFLHPKLRKIDAVLITLKLITLTLWRLRRVVSAPTGCRCTSAESVVLDGSGH